MLFVPQMIIVPCVLYTQKQELKKSVIVDIYMNDELQVSFWCSNGRYECDLSWYLDCKVIDIKIKDGYLSLEVE